MRASLITMTLSVLLNIFVSPCLAATASLPAPMKQNQTQVATQTKTNTVATPAHFQVSALMESGSLEKNIQRIAQQFGWGRVIWDVPNDYEWVGAVQVHGDNLKSILEKVLGNYPLQATFYHGNHVLVITPRTLQ